MALHSEQFQSSQYFIHVQDKTILAILETDHATVILSLSNFS